ncbi:MAG: MBL fold metallo-hydrolase [Deltaproteobacteria bacterium]|jgi:phosphoribosyl 1,2-cyclic phosphodiesterase|nr:MBL fold metallo-hydrolase [Deltaproteobacteria bacterium]
MNIKFWGVRGSLPSPITPIEIRNRIKEALETVLRRQPAPQDLDAFIDELPPSTASTVGGNTPCLEIREGDEVLIIDAGTGIVGLGRSLHAGPGSCELSELMAAADLKGALFHNRLAVDRPRHLTLLLTHTHWDHIQGFPFFGPAYHCGNVIDVYGENGERIKEALTVQQASPRLFPVSLQQAGADIRFHSFPANGLTTGPFSIDSLPLPHPGGSLAFRIKVRNRVVVFATDYELVDAEPDSDRNRVELTRFAQDADVFISDTQYTYLESMTKEGWGHSNPLKVVEMAMKADVKKFFLFHHDPYYSDAKLYDMLRKTVTYTNLLYPGHDLEVRLAIEGETVTV